ncbi:NAD(P)H-dependent flavin oxidoreductase [Mycolicibacterium arenosum]|uniref:Nitronate monooxygenase n=1 Tax=Mycolicibacterium arenosum TaxID=2952157 RepID=A0ABT1M345_9MYCO|nr:nitronate monooxygenase [Mycolicibacterium sp. CAU 1645]MCP9273578.1 nitronate monooxygenase [Mycolicibacterium sp. CAU 1645]
MGVRTALTDLLGIEHPIVLAPMGGVAGGELAGAVSEAGGLGLLGAGGGQRDWLEREIDILRARTEKPWGVGLLAWALELPTLEWVIAQRPSMIMVSFGDPAPFVQSVRAANIPLAVQVTTLSDARQALELGADVVVAQGAEAGGHGEGRGTLPFVPAVVDVAGDTPVLAAGGIADGRGLAAALVLGAAGAVIGTRFEATPEALLSAEETAAIVAANASGTTRDRVLDVAQDSAWPRRFTARTLRNRFTDTWHDKEDALRFDSIAKEEFTAGVDRGDMDYLPIWAGEAVDLIAGVEPAAAVVERIADEARWALNSVRTNPGTPPD